MLETVTFNPHGPDLLLEGATLTQQVSEAEQVLVFWLLLRFGQKSSGFVVVAVEVVELSQELVDGMSVCRDVAVYDVSFVLIHQPDESVFLHSFLDEKEVFSLRGFGCLYEFHAFECNPRFLFSQR